MNASGLTHGQEKSSSTGNPENTQPDIRYDCSRMESKKKSVGGAYIRQNVKTW